MNPFSTNHDMHVHPAGFCVRGLETAAHMSRFHVPQKGSRKQARRLQHKKNLEGIWDASRKNVMQSNLVDTRMHAMSFLFST
jgi:hypothetical protein